MMSQILNKTLRFYLLIIRLLKHFSELALKVMWIKLNYIIMVLIHCNANFEEMYILWPANIKIILSFLLKNFKKVFLILVDSLFFFHNVSEEKKIL